MLSGKKDLALANGENWFAVHTQAKCERRAELNLDAQGYRTYYPKVLKIVRRRQLRAVKAPFFPRYLFIAMTWNGVVPFAVHSTSGLSRLLASRDGAPDPQSRPSIGVVSM